MKNKLILASASPSRLALLKSLRIQDIHVIPADIDESIQIKEKPGNYVLRLAEQKARTIAHRYPNSYVMGADTIIGLGRQILQKASHAEEASKQIERLSGRRHRVYTGVFLCSPDGKMSHRLVQTHVAFKRLSPEEKRTFLNSNEWEGVCGYRIHGIASAFIVYLRGTATNVMGLPIYEAAQLLHGAGFPIWT